METRKKWIDLMTKIAYPVLKSLSEERLYKDFPSEFNSEKVSFRCLEAFGRTMCGIAPWLELKGLKGEEAELQKEYRLLVRKAIDKATDPESRDFMNFTEGSQPLVDTAFLAHAIVRAPEELYNKLDERVKKNLINTLKASRVISSFNNNWLLFSAMIETALYIMGEETVEKRITDAIDKFREEWYVGDGNYSDGINFHFDYYNSFVIHPMYIDIVKNLPQYSDWIPVAIKRGRRYAQILERMIAPDGTYTVVGRSVCYRFGAFQLLSQSVLQSFVPEEVSKAQIRCGLTAVLDKCAEGGMFDEKGWLKPGVYGYQPELAESYINTGSLYLCSAVFLVLGVSPEDDFWTAADEDWTSKKIWSGKKTVIDHSVD